MRQDFCWMFLLDASSQLDPVCCCYWGKYCRLWIYVSIKKSTDVAIAPRQTGIISTSCWSNSRQISMGDLYEGKESSWISTLYSSGRQSYPCTPSMYIQECHTAPYCQTSGEFRLLTGGSNQPSKLKLCKRIESAFICFSSFFYFLSRHFSYARIGLPYPESFISNTFSDIIPTDWYPHIFKHIKSANADPDGDGWINGQT